MANKARKRQQITGEKYMTALMHIRAECRKCQAGTPCEACLKEPCWTCRGECPATVGKDPEGPHQCRFDDLQADGTKECVTCRRPWPPSRTSKPAISVGFKIRGRGNPCLDEIPYLSNDDHVHEIVGSMCIRCNQVVK